MAIKSLQNPHSQERVVDAISNEILITDLESELVEIVESRYVVVSRTNAENPDVVWEEQLYKEGTPWGDY